MRGNYKRRAKNIKWLFAILCIALLLILMVGMHGAEWILTRTAPSIMQKISSQAQLKREKGEMAFEIDFLKKKNAELEIENSILKEQINQTQKGPLSTEYWKNYPDVNTVSARIILRDPTGLSTSFIIDAGSSNGVAKNMVVIGREAVIGRIVEVHPSFSRIRTTESSKIAFGAIVKRTRELGVVSSENNELILKYLSINADLHVGDEIVTSGTTDITPGGLYIGKVAEVVLREKGEELEAHVQSPENIRTLEYVRVVLSTRNIPKEAASTKGDLS